MECLRLLLLFLYKFLGEIIVIIDALRLCTISKRERKKYDFPNVEEVIDLLN